MKLIKKAEKWFSRHVYYNSLVHLLIGIGIGVLITYPFVGSHPVRFGVALIAIGVLGHLLAFTEK